MTEIWKLQQRKKMAKNEEGETAKATAPTNNIWFSNPTEREWAHATLPAHVAQAK